MNIQKIFELPPPSDILIFKNCEQNLFSLHFRLLNLLIFPQNHLNSMPLLGTSKKNDPPHDESESTALAANQSCTASGLADLDLASLHYANKLT